MAPDRAIHAPHRSATSQLKYTTALADGRWSWLYIERPFQVSWIHAPVSRCGEPTGSGSEGNPPETGGLRREGAVRSGARHVGDGR